MRTSDGGELIVERLEIRVAFDRSAPDGCYEVRYLDGVRVQRVRVVDGGVERQASRDHEAPHALLRLPGPIDTTPEEVARRLMGTTKGVSSMACRVGITTNMDERRQYWLGREPTLRNWRLLGTYATKAAAQSAENNYAAQNDCAAEQGGPDIPGPWYLYRFDY